MQNHFISFCSKLIIQKLYTRNFIKLWLIACHSRIEIWEIVCAHLDWCRLFLFIYQQRRLPNENYAIKVLSCPIAPATTTNTKWFWIPSSSSSFALAMSKLQWYEIRVDYDNRKRTRKWYRDRCDAIDCLMHQLHTHGIDTPSNVSTNVFIAGGAASRRHATSSFRIAILMKIQENSSFFVLVAGKTI